MGQIPAGAAAPHPDVAAEQEVIDHAYSCLRFMYDRAVRIKSLGYLGGNVHAESGLTPETRAKWETDKQHRVDTLAESSSALCFGRIDRRDGERFYVGRRHVEDRDGQPVVTDWRTPAAIPFYRATIADPMSLHLRRRFLIEGQHLVDLVDENLEYPSTDEIGAYVPDPLLAEIERTRTGQMRDIVATIQAEQDVIIRAPLQECVVVQGGPGTGKTAVGLHRAAFLLYAHREQLERERLLIVGPNKIFFRYISQVLPSLGETAAVQLTIEGLAGARYRVRAEDDPDVARLKGDVRMASVIRNAIYTRLRVPKEDMPLVTPFGQVTLPADAIGGIVEAGLSSPRPTNESRKVVRERLVSLAWDIYLETRATDFAQWSPFVDAVRASRPLKALLERIWPALSAGELVRRLFGNRPTLHTATDGILSSMERDRLGRKPTPRLSEERWTMADLALLHEAEALINGTGPTYGHIVVDEAQDLSAMELRMLARRSRRGSMTVLGDLAQATSLGGQITWDHALEQLAAPTGRYEELTVGYRVPGPILDFANQLLADAAPDVPLTTSARTHGNPPDIQSVAPEELRVAVANEAHRMAERWTSVAIVTPASLRDGVTDALNTAHVDFVDGQKASGLGERATLLLAQNCKGLEFDAVLVVEPTRIMAESGSGARLLYIVLTRAVQQLTILHAEPLPTAIRPGPLVGAEPLTAFAGTREGPGA